MNVIQQALKLQGIDAAWQGPEPADATEITNEYLNTILDGELPRMIRSVEDTGSIVNLVQLRLDYASLSTQIIEERRVTAIKMAAGKHIEAHVPDWKQRNLTARSVELVNVSKDRPYTPQEQGEVDAINVVWAWVKQVRATSDAAENEGTLPHAVIWPPFPI